MTLTSSTGGRSRSLILTAMIFAVSMTFIDQTIISIAVRQTVFLVTAGIMAAGALVALAGCGPGGSKTQANFAPHPRSRRRTDCASSSMASVTAPERPVTASREGL
jgi:hypothetical protein